MGVAGDALRVRLDILPELHAACVDYVPAGSPEDGRSPMHDEVARSFGRIRAWMKERGLDPRTRTVGAIEVAEGRLLRYVCAIQIPSGVAERSADVGIRNLAGGRYAVLEVDKNPEVIGPCIGRFHDGYLPAHSLSVEPGRPAYEVYFETTMEYCAPIRS
jgi:DNA gyrase inhibitor GyrI